MMMERQRRGTTEIDQVRRDKATREHNDYLTLKRVREANRESEKVSRTLRRRVVQTATSLKWYFDPDDSLDPVTVADNGRLKGTPPVPSESGDIRDLRSPQNTAMIYEMSAAERAELQSHLDHAAETAADYA